MSIPKDNISEIIKSITCPQLPADVPTDIEPKQKVEKLKRPHGRPVKKDPNHIKKAPSEYNKFVAEKVHQLHVDQKAKPVKIAHRELFKQAASMWNKKKDLD